MNEDIIKWWDVLKINKTGLNKLNMQDSIPFGQMILEYNYQLHLAKEKWQKFKQQQWLINGETF
jgi:hypothetical protein